MMAALSPLRRWRGACLPLLLGLCWWYESGQGAARAYVFVPPAIMWRDVFALLRSGQWLPSLLASLGHFFVGMLLALLAGLFGGAALALSPWMRRLFGPLIHTLRQLPIIGWIPLLQLWLGNGELPKVLIIVITAVQPMLLAAQEGLSGGNERLRQVGAVLMFTPLEQFRYVRLPAAAPQLWAGLLQAQVLAWVGTVIGELFFIDGAGLGNLMTSAQNGGQMGVVLLCVALIALIGQVVHLVLVQLGHGLLSRHHLEEAL